MRLPDDARPTTFNTAQLVAGGTDTFVMSTDLLGVITCISGGFITGTSATFQLTQNAITIYAGFGGGASGTFLIGSFGQLWIPVNAGDVLVWGFNSSDAASTCGVVVGGWQYNQQG